MHPKRFMYFIVRVGSGSPLMHGSGGRGTARAYAFTPDAAEVDKARRFVAAYREAAARGEAVALVDGEFIAMDLVPRMERIIALSEEAAAI